MAGNKEQNNPTQSLSWMTFPVFSVSGGNGKGRWKEGRVIGGSGAQALHNSNGLVTDHKRCA